MKNWFGLNTHRTDSYVHWTTPDKDRVADANALRAAYDKIQKAGLKSELEFLLKASYNSGSLDEADANIGPEG